MRMISKKPFNSSGKRAERVASAPGIMLAALATLFVSGTAMALESSDIAGVWTVTRDQGQRQCRISLNAERTDKGDFIVGVPPACRHAMPLLAKAGHWSMTDSTHLALTTPDGDSVLDLSLEGEAFTGAGPDGATYKLTSVRSAGRRAVGIDPAAETAQPGKPAIIDLTAKPPLPAQLAQAEQPRRPVLAVRPSELAGRYAILRDKTRDTGCMLTLDNQTKVRGGDRAALAPACRDQGIVVFDPVAWQIVNGRLVLTAKAGHTTHLDLQPDGTWLKDPTEGRSLALKKL
ncbi:MAG: AprI/Inh family metalloprotease inhibitor [Beijerinckiaceae bacterium]|nr:AprI/Inh family metalloprotease inhibitor [Beijerinckiaceae bacterium]